MTPSAEAVSVRDADRRGATSGYELLLRWASECGTGSWLAFRDAHDWVFNAGQQDGKQVRATTTIHAFAMLGHLEIDWSEGRWAVASPSITILPNAGAHGVVSGARTRELLDAFGDATASDAYYGEAHRQGWGPDAIFVAAADESAIENLAELLNIRYEVCISERLAKMLPSLGDYLALARSTPAAQGYGVERFSVRILKWERTTQEDSPGLYRYDLWGRPEYRFINDDMSVYSVDLAVGTHAEIARCGKREIQYARDSVNGTLVVPFGAQLPVLQARTAVLCTGLMPLLRDGKWRYPNVPFTTAEAIASSLGQALVMTDHRQRGTRG